MKRSISLVLSCFFYFSVIGQANEERIYLHTDKQCYVAGETIWMKAYLMVQFAPDDLSSNLWVELLDTKGNILTTKKMPVFWGTAAGNIDVDLTVSQGLYILRAYTALGLKKGNISTKTVYLFNPSSKASTIDASKDTYQCDFFANNNQLIAAATNSLYFKAGGMYNSPVSITGTILDENMKTVLAFKDIYKGLGKLEFVPELGKTYTAKIDFPNGSSKTYTLPPVVPEGVIVSAEYAGSQISLKIINKGNEKKKLTLLGLMGDRPAFRHPFEFRSNEYNSKIPVDALPAGVLNILVLDGNDIIGRTKAFVHRPTRLPLMKIKKENIRVDTEFVDVSLEFQDSVSGTFSISITDFDSELRPIHNTMLAELLINQESLSKVSLVEKESIDKKEIMDMVVNTTRYSEVSIDNLDKDNIFLTDSNYITIAGKLVDSKTKRPVTKGDLIIFFKGKDSSSNTFNPVISKDGSFAIKNLVFYDTASINYKWIGKQTAELVMDDEKPVDSDINSLAPFVADISIFNNPENTRKAQSVYDELNDTFNNSKVLSNVTVSTKYPGTLKDQVNKKYTSGLFSSSVMARSIDLIHEPPQNNGINIFDYVQGKFGDLVVSRGGLGQYTLTSTRNRSLTGGSPAIKLFLNQLEVSPDIILGVLLSEVAMIKYFPPGNARLPGIGGAGVLAIYTKTREDMNGPTMKFFPNRIMVPGYSPVKDFSEEIQNRKNPDNHTTVYWDPNILVDPSNKKYSFKLLRSKVAKRLRVVVEGFTFEGDIIYFDTIIERDQ